MSYSWRQGPLIVSYTTSASNLLHCGSLPLNLLLITPSSLLDSSSFVFRLTILSFYSCSFSSHICTSFLKSLFSFFNISILANDKSTLAWFSFYFFFKRVGHIHTGDVSVIWTLSYWQGLFFFLFLFSLSALVLLISPSCMRSSISQIYFVEFRFIIVSRSLLWRLLYITHFSLTFHFFSCTEGESLN